MENVSRAMMIGFGTIIFAAALSVIIIMYTQVNQLLDVAENYPSMRRVVEGE